MTLAFDQDNISKFSKKQRMLSSPRYLVLPLSIWRPALLCFEFVFRLWIFEMVHGLLLSFFSFAKERGLYCLQL